MRGIFSGFETQLTLFVREPAQLFILALVPLQTAVFLTIFIYFGRDDLIYICAIAPPLMAMWQISLLIAGDLLAQDRRSGIFALILTTFSGYFFYLYGRMLAISTISILGFVLSYLTLIIFSDFFLPAAVILRAIPTFLFLAPAAASLATFITTILVRAREPRVWQNALTYPVFLLSGIVVPTSFLGFDINLPGNPIFLPQAAKYLTAVAKQEPSDFGFISMSLLLSALFAALLSLLSYQSLIKKVRSGKANYA